MPLCKTEGIVLHSRKQGETSKILSIYTLHYGRMSLIAKGARGLRSHYGGVVETFNHIAMVFYHKETREIQYLNQAEILDAFIDIHSQLGKIALAAIACEIVERHEVAGHSNPALFRLLMGYLQVSEHSTHGLRNVLRSFQLKYLDLAGFKPELKFCFSCGLEISGEDVFFDFADGGYRCHKCSGVNATVNLSAAALRFLDYLSKAAIEKTALPLTQGSLGREMDWFILNYMRYHIEDLSELKSLAYLQQLNTNLRKVE